MKPLLLVLVCLLLFAQSANAIGTRLQEFDQILMPIVYEWQSIAAADTLETYFVNVSGYSVLAVIMEVDTVSGSAGGTTDSCHVKPQYQTGEILTEYRNTPTSLLEVTRDSRIQVIDSSDTTAVKNAGTDWTDILTDVGFGADRGAVYPVPCTWLKFRVIGLSTNFATAYTKYRLWLLLAPI